MSATLPNLELLSTWLDGDLYTTRYRPVPLLEMVKIGDQLINSDGRLLRSLGNSRFKNDEDHVIHLCSETVVNDGCSVLIFCPTKNWCEKLADTIAREFYDVIRAAIMENNVPGYEVTSNKFHPNERDLTDVLELLRRSPSGLDPTLGKMVRCAVAYHHAGLTFEERDIIEGAFRSGVIKVVVATSTLSSGVNLPARRVIVRTPIFHGCPIDALVYKQMIGRAGRKGVDIKGESVLVCKQSESKIGMSLMTSDLEPITSCLNLGGPGVGGLSSSMKRAILEIIVNKVASTLKQVNVYARCTMLAAAMKLATAATTTATTTATATTTNNNYNKTDADDDDDGSGNSNDEDAISTCVKYLVDNEFVQIVKVAKDKEATTTTTTTAAITTAAKIGKNNKNVSEDSGDYMYVPTQLGQAVVSSGLSPDEGLKVFVELQKARRCFVLENDLHIIYLVTPLYMQDQFTIDWYNYLCIWEGLSPGCRRVAEVVGVQEIFLSKAVHGKLMQNADRSVERMVSIHKRFYMSLALYDLVNEVPLNSTCQKFKVNKGSLQTLQQSSSTFSGMVTAFCSKLGWHNMESLFQNFQCRLCFGVQPELVDLVRITIMNAQLARCFFSAGYVNVTSLATANIEDVVKIVKKASPFLSSKRMEGESEADYEERMRTSRCVFVSGGDRGMTQIEAAQQILQEARQLVADDLIKLGIKKSVSDDGEDCNDSNTKISPAVSSLNRSKSKKYRRRVNKSAKVNSSKRGGEVRKSQNVSRNKQKSVKIERDVNVSILTPPVSFVDSQKLKRDKTFSQNIVNDSVKCIVNLNIPPANNEQISNFSDENHKNNLNDTFKINIDILNQNEKPQKNVHNSLHTSRSPLKVIEGNVVIQTKNVDSEADDSDDILFENDSVDDACLIGQADSSQTNVGKCEKSQPMPDNIGMSEIEEEKSKDEILKEDSLVDGQLMRNDQVDDVINDGLIDEFLLNSFTNIKRPVDCTEVTTNLIEDGSMKGLLAGQPFVSTSEPTTDKLNMNLFDDASNSSEVSLFDSSQCLRERNDVAGYNDDLDLEGDLNNASPREEDLLSTSCFERKQFCSMLLDGRTPYSEEMFEENANDVNENYVVDANAEINCEIKAENYENNERISVADDFFERSTVDIEDKANEQKVDEGNQKVENRGDGEISFEVSDLFSSFLTCAPSIKTKHSPNLPEKIEQNDVKIDGKSQIESRSNIQTSTHNNDNNNSNNDNKKETICNNVYNFDTNLPFTPTMKKFKSVDISTHLSPDVELIMNTFCDDTCWESSNKNRKKPPKRALNFFLESSNAVIQDKKKLKMDCNNTKKEQEGNFTELKTFGNTSNTKKSIQANKFSSNILETKFPETTDETAFTKKITTPESTNLVAKTAEDQLNQNIDPFLDLDGDDSECFIPPTPPLQTTPKLHSSRNLTSNIKLTPRHLHLGAVKTTTDYSVNNSNNRDNNNNSNNNNDDNNNNTNMNDVLKRNKVSTIANTNDTSITLSSTLESLTIFDVASNRDLFEKFLDEWSTRNEFSLCVACDRVKSTENKINEKKCASIGGKFIQKNTITTVAATTSETFSDINTQNGFPTLEKSMRVVGMAVSWEGCDVYYVSFLNSVENSDLDRSMAAPDLDQSLTVEERWKGVKKVLEKDIDKTGSRIHVEMFDSKSQYRLLSSTCSILIAGLLVDPKVASWLLDPSSRELNVHSMVTLCCPEMLFLLDGIDCPSGLMSLGMTSSEITSSRMRSSVESVLVRRSMKTMKMKLGEVSNLWQCFISQEMPILKILADMELNGMGFDYEESERQKSLLLRQLAYLEESSYSAAGHDFNLANPDDVSRVLYVELGLPPSGERGVVKKGRGAGRKGRNGIAKYSTAKNILEKLRSLHPLPTMLLEWRRLSSALSKVVFPLQRSKFKDEHVTRMYRIHAVADMHTATGRVAMKDPNLQNVPKDFQMGEDPETAELVNESFNYSYKLFEDEDDDDDDDGGDAAGDGMDNQKRSKSISMRHSFVAFQGGTLLAADYSQLELRVIAHMSQDRKLIDLLNSGADVFRNIACQLHSCEEAEVTDSQRQQAKQVCYGMIYGIGSKALGEQLKVSEDDAAVFMETFKTKYSGIRSFLHNTVYKCRTDGYVTMTSGRRRYLQRINDQNIHLRAHAERQAVNTTIQGSGADFVKRAMIKIDEELKKQNWYASSGGGSYLPHLHLRGAPLGSFRTQEKPYIPPRGAYLILQLHDELIYEVNERDLTNVAEIVRWGMESVGRDISVRLPVKLKVGRSWGKMKEYKLE